MRLPGRDDELAEGAGTKVRECGVCRVQRVDLVDHHAGGPLGLVAGQKFEGRAGRVGGHGHDREVLGGELVW